ncbi:MAG: sodium/solute symporter [Pirellulaceae bacterium]|nr:sodium/solute symporter [Pirellulaceae bacterium]
MTNSLDLSTLDYIIFFATLIGAMLVGFIVGRKEDSSEDYFLAGRSIRWFGVAGSIFGSNVSANHMIGMLGVGFSIGFAQSHFELGAIAGLLLMCYGFLPVYRKLRVYTLSEFLEHRYDHRSRLMYAIIMVILMAFVQMVPALYIGSRTICELMGNDAIVTQANKVDGAASDAQQAQPADHERTVAQIAQPNKAKRLVNMTYYSWFVISLAVIAASYTILGGLKAVVYTDVIQSVLMLIAGIAVALFTFNEIGGWGAMMAFDHAAASSKMHLYLPTNHPDLPWSGVLTGLMFMHCFYWGTNQFIVQRALAATSDKEARVGIIAAGFLKLLIPFFAIATGVAAYYLFQTATEFKGQQIDPDTAFPVLVNALISPLGMGLVGLIAAGLIGAILSSIDSMMNSAATILTIDVYQRYIKPKASDEEMIRMGRYIIIALMAAAALMAIFVINPNSEANFFLTIANYSNYLTPGLLVAFILGIFWKRGTTNAAFVAILAGIAFSYIVPAVYDSEMSRTEYDLAMLEEPDLQSVVAGMQLKNFNGLDNVQKMTIEELGTHLENQIRPAITPLLRTFGPKLNFFHRVIFVIGLTAVLYIGISYLQQPDPEKSRITWTDLGGHAPDHLRSLSCILLISVAVYALLGWLMVQGTLNQVVAALLASGWTLAAYARQVLRSDPTATAAQHPLQRLLQDERSLAGVLAAIAMFMMYYFY